jgi:hypothetical protein
MAASVRFLFEGNGQLGQNLAGDAISFGEDAFAFFYRRDQPCQLFGNRHQVIAGHDDRLANRERVFIVRQNVSAPLVELDLPLFAFPGIDVELFLVGLVSDLLREFGLWGSFAALTTAKPRPISAPTAAANPDVKMTSRSTADSRISIRSFHRR